MKVRKNADKSKQKIARRLLLVPISEAGHVVGEHHHRAKLSDADIDLILELRASGLTYREITGKFDDPEGVSVSQSMVEKVCRGARRFTPGVRWARRPVRT